VDIKQASSVLSTLNPSERRVIYTTGQGIEVTATRTDKLSEHDFAVGLHIPSRDEFNPTHVRLLIDLHLKTISDNQKATNLFEAFEAVYEGMDCIPIARSFEKVRFPMQLDGADVNLLYAQLLMIEQDFNYGPGKKKSSYDPARGFLMSFIRWVASQRTQIDRIITAAVRNFPPPREFGTKQSGQLTIL
jgi:hypothetical protein